MPAIVQRQVSVVLTYIRPVEIPQLQILDMPVAVQRQVATVLTLLTPLETSQLQILDKVVDMPVVVQQQMPRSPWRLHSCFFSDRIDDMPIVVQWQVPTGQTVQKIVEVPQWQFIFNVIGIPVLAQRQDPLLRQLVPAVIVVVPMVQTVQKPSRIRRLPVQSPQVQSFRKVVGMPGC